MPIPPQTQPHLQRHPLNTVGRDFAVGDIHGCFGKLDTALRAVRFSQETDRLFAVGDLVDRGPESADVLAWLDRPWFHSICGNHDLMAWRRAAGIPLHDVDHRRHGGEWLDDCDDALRLRIADRLSRLPLAIEVQTPQGPIGLVHADFPYDDWQTVHHRALSQDDVDACLWSIDRHRLHYTGSVRNVRALIHGHLTLSDVAQLGNVHYIDTGGWRQGGRFTLLDLHTLKPAT